MKHFIIKSAFLSIILLAIAQNGVAQHGPEKTNSVKAKKYSSTEWYTSLSFGDQWLFNGNGFTGTLKINGGTWFNKFWGLKITTQLGKLYRDSGNSTKHWQTSLNATLNMLPVFGNYNQNTPFSFNLSTGLGYNMLRYRHNDTPNTHTVSLNVGAQTGYDFNPHWGAFIELSGYLLPKYTNKESKFPVILAGDWNIGIQYKFTAKKSNCRIKELETQIDELNKKINYLIAKSEEKKVETEKSKVILAPKNEIASIDIYFDDFSAYLSEEQKKKMDVIGNWMTSNEDFSINVAVFTDNTQNPEISERIRKNRMEVIRSVIVEKYGVDPQRIHLIEAEKLGYKNLSGCNAKIIFTK